MSWQLTIASLLVMPVIIFASRKFQRDSNAAYLEVRERIGQNLSELQEGISGVRVIQAYAQEDEQTRQFRASNRSLKPESSSYSISPERSWRYSRFMQGLGATQIQTS